MTGVDWISLAGVVAGVGAALGAVAAILGRLFVVRRHIADLRLEFESRDGERVAVKLNPDDPEQAEALAELFAKDRIVSIDPKTDTKEIEDGTR